MTYEQNDLLDDELIPYFVTVDIDSNEDYEVLEVYPYDERGNVDYRVNYVHETEPCHQRWAETIKDKQFTIYDKQYQD